MNKRKIIFILLLFALTLQGFSQESLHFVSLLYQCGEPNEYTAQITPNIKLENLGSSDIYLPQVKIRYYRTTHDYTNEIMEIDYSSVGSDRVICVYTSDYVEIGFRQDAGYLYAGTTLHLRARLHHYDWSQYFQGNDLSFKPSHYDYFQQPEIAAYYNDRLLWGWFDFWAGDPSPMPTAKPETLSAGKSISMQAEDAEIYGGITETLFGGYTGSSYINIDNNLGRYIEWFVYSDYSENVTFRFVYANGASLNRPADILVNGKVKIYSSQFNPTGSWANWNATTVTLPLRSGSNVIRLLAISYEGLANIDRVDITSSSTPEPALTEIPTEVPTEVPTETPTEVPTEVPSEIPTEIPTEVPTEVPSEIPTEIPTEVPSEIPTETPTEVPTPVEDPTIAPTEVPTPLPEGEAETTFIEAEDAACYWPWASKSDSYKDNSPLDSASQEIFMGIMGYVQSSSEPPKDGHMVFTFTVKQGGAYNLYARTRAPNDGADELWVSIDDQSFFKWDTLGSSFVPSVWQWSNFYNTKFSAGTSHRVTFAYTNSENKIDMIAITNDPYFEGNEPDPKPLSSALSMEVPPSSPPATRYGNLQTLNGKLCDENGNPVQLRGIATHGPQWYRVVPNETIPNLKKTFEIDVVRIAMYVDGGMPYDFWNGYMADKEKRKYYVSQLVNDAIEEGIYVIIDWHIHKNMDFNDEYFGEPNKPEAVKFFDEMSRIYAKYPNVIFEIANETGAGEASWSQLKAYSQDLIPVIRANDNDGHANIIIVPTPDWDQQITLPIGDPLTGDFAKNIVYAFHFYASSHDHLKPLLESALAAKLPIFVSEFGTCDYSVSYNDFTKADSWLDDYLKPNQISWVNWSLCNRDDASALIKPGVSMAGPWTDDDLTENGLYIKARLTGNSPNITLAPTPEPTPYVGPGISKDNPVEFSTSDIGSYKVIDLSNGYSWVKFSESVQQLHIRNTGIQFAVTVENDNANTLASTNGSMVWDWDAASSGAKGTDLMKIVWNDGNASVSLSWNSEAASGDNDDSIYTPINANFSFTGTGEYFWVLEDDITGYINSWNIESLVINGVDIANKYTSAKNLPPQSNGKYYIHFVSKYSYGHGEFMGYGG
ncbi:MAG: cellulase family glycosylhydrolase [Spirochaetales bacterium]|nr:cellulase family glycosylhydrolase [Spirochaetales bacterium]